MNLAYRLLDGKLGKIMPNNSKTVHFGDGDPNDPNTRIKLSINIGEFKSRIRRDGYDLKLASNLCLVALYQLWEDEYRDKIAKEVGLIKNSLTLDIFGDIRIIRRSIIHNGSKRFGDFEKIKILNFIKDRETIFMSSFEFGCIIEKIKEGLMAINEI